MLVFAKIKIKHLEPPSGLSLLQNVSRSLYVNKHISYIYIYTYNSATLYIKINVFEKKLTINMRVWCVCMHVCMDVNRVLNERCAQLGMLRCKINVVVFIGEPNT